MKPFGLPERRGVTEGARVPGHLKAMNLDSIARDDILAGEKAHEVITLVTGHLQDGT